MDIGKYIGKFLVKNNYCSLSGLGVFELKKLNASVRSSEGTVSPPSYQISFTPVGSIDDNFASFIANHENVSISNASNHIKQFCIQVKQQLAEQGHFHIDHLGKLHSNGSSITFQQLADLDLGYETVPTPLAEIKHTPTATEGSTKLDFSYPPARSSYRGKSSPALKYAAIGIGALLVLGAIYLVYDYAQKNSVDTNSLNTPPPTETPATAPPAAAASAALPAGTYKVALFTFSTEAQAQAKATKLSKYGNQASVTMLDSSHYVVALEAVQAQGDTAKLVDSLRKFFNPKGNVYILP